ncbi:complement C1q-like protein 4 [Anabas testudineus]|uniref:Uncharacterized protein n=1 Tax=Anabas testudineus TaxID=64144 RepID=A0A7N6AU28_ANATE|nr:complement C1q-like protein 4 [Anabas testudineus]
MFLFLCLLVFFCCGLNMAQHGFSQSETVCPDSCLLRNELMAMKEKIEIMETMLRDSETRLINSESRIAEMKEQASTKVIFSAALAHPGSFGPFEKETAVIYKTVITNVGSAYSPVSGDFTAPVAGVYYFNFFYHAGGSHQGQLFLYKNDQIVVMTHDHQSDTDTADNGGNAVFLQLQQGDRVYVRLAANRHIWGYGQHTTFNGFLVTQMDS